MCALFSQVCLKLSVGDSHVGGWWKKDNGFPSSFQILMSDSARLVCTPLTDCLPWDQDCILPVLCLIAEDEIQFAGSRFCVIQTRCQVSGEKLYVWASVWMKIVKTRQTVLQNRFLQPWSKIVFTICAIYINTQTWGKHLQLCTSSLNHTDRSLVVFEWGNLFMHFEVVHTLLAD